MDRFLTVAWKKKYRNPEIMSFVFIVVSVCVYVRDSHLGIWFLDWEDLVQLGKWKFWIFWNFWDSCDIHGMWTTRLTIMANISHFISEPPWSKRSNLKKSKVGGEYTFERNCIWARVCLNIFKFVYFKLKPFVHKTT